MLKKYNFKNLYLSLKKSLEKFPVTIITALIMTIIYTLSIDSNFISSKTLTKISIFGLTFIVGTFFTETVSKKSSIKSIFMYIISVGLAIFYGFIIENLKSEELIETMAKIWCCYLIVFPIITIYFHFKKSEKTFEEYITHITINILKISLISSLLAVGIAIVTAIFVYLILGGEGYSLILRLEVLMLGIYLFPTMLYAFCNTEGEFSKFSKTVIKYVLGTLVIAAFAIIYMYIIKILLLRTIPSNQIFRILGTLFILGLPIWTMVAAFKEDKLLDKINKKLPILFIPFILLQIYSIGIRISNNGITEMRYLCIMLIIFEVIYIMIYLKRKEKIGNILIVFSILIVVSILVPYINMYKVSILSQYNNLKIYKQKTEYTEQDKEKINGAYRYLKYKEDGDKYINKLLKKEDIEEIELFDDYYNQEFGIEYEKHIKYINAAKSVESINVEEYDKVYFVEAYESNYQDYETINETFSNVRFNAENRFFYLNILQLVQKYMENEEYIRNYFKQNNEIQIDENIKLIIKNFYIEYNQANDEVYYYNIEGYLLVK